MQDREFIVAEVMDQVERATTKGCQTRGPLYCGNIILLHDGGGDRTATVQALPAVIEGLRARGFKIVSVEALLNRCEVCSDASVRREENVCTFCVVSYRMDNVPVRFVEPRNRGKM